MIIEYLPVGYAKGAEPSLREISVGDNVRGLRILSVKISSARELRQLLGYPMWTISLVNAWRLDPL